ncbi:putative transmembrane protein 170 [Plasmodiophora brassicae]|uniref:Uncharacterized protein n=1 Tax=Plasmodiophora brassicae TaxID=37360 RepID=A0A0G4ILT7_PLABS|nr:hypothetical protein PBRA_004833 [Plasmodiophora brassicae]SPQ93312.1 unnamed protein product [Plasmodiophora brassicae]
MSDVTVEDVRMLTTFPEMWTHIIAWTVSTVAAIYWCAGVLACRVLARPRTLYIWVPILSATLGATLAFLTASLTTVMMVAVYVSIPYSIGVDIAGGLGVGQAVIICYFHLGRFSGDDSMK